METLKKNIQKLEGEITEKQSTWTHNKACAKSIKATNSILLQYERELKEELENRKAQYNHDLMANEERIASYKKTFQWHKDFYTRSPLAQKLIALQAENENMKSRIKAWDDQITTKQNELDILNGPAANSVPAEKLSDSISVQQPPAKPEDQLAPQTEDSDSFIDILSLHLNQTTDDYHMSEDANAEEISEENKVQNTSIPSHDPEEEETDGIVSQHLLCEQRGPDVVQGEEENQEVRLDDQILGHQSSASDKEEALMEAVEEVVVEEEEWAPVEESIERTTTFLQFSSEETNPQSSSATVKTAPSTPKFPFNFSPASSPHHGTSDTKSPAFMFSLNPDPSTPGSSGFGFNMGSSQDEESSFAFTSTFFSEKETPESKSSNCSGFPFGRAEQIGDFQFAFAAKTPQTNTKNNPEEDFPFSFNF
ncbi:uncharacterized protein LOC109996851 isoform X2 [Xyrichtys novacula]|nr:uncharacterized protein LOC109996851 isoform X2 [Xyrichtys novacula]